MPKQSHYLSLIDAQIETLKAKRQTACAEVDAFTIGLENLEAVRKSVAAGARPRAKRRQASTPPTPPEVVTP